MATSTETAALILAVDARQTDKGAVSLDNLTKSAQRTDAQIDRYNQTIARQNAAMAQSTAAVRAQVQAKAALTTHVTSADKGMQGLTLNSSMARRELGRMGTDLAMGNYGRLANTSLTLANYTGLMGRAFSGAGAAILGTIGAVGLFAAEAIKAATITDTLNRAILSTGDYAGVTARQLQAMSKQISGATYGNAVEIMGKLAGSGRIAGDSLQAAGQAAADMAYLTGESMDKTAGAVLRLAEDPARSVASLNDQFHFLTATQAENIITMQETGDKAGAAAIAIDALGEVMHRRAAQAKEDGPWFATAFEKWKAGASNIGVGLGEILTLGGHQTIIDQYTTAVKRYDEAVKQLDNDRANGRTGLAHDLNVSTAQGAYNDVMSIWNDPKFQTARDKNQINAVVQQVQDDGVQATQTLAKLGITLDGMKDKQTKVNEAAAALYKAHLAGVNFPGVNFNGATADTPQGSGWDAIVAKLDPKKRARAGSQSDPFASLNGLVQGAQVKDSTFGTAGQTTQVTSILAIVDAGAKLIASGQDIATVQAKVAVGVSALNSLYAKQADQLKSQNVVALDQYREAVNNKLAADKMQLDNQVARIGMGQQEYERQTQINKVYQDYARIIENLQKQRAQKGANTELIDGQIASQTGARDIAVAQTQASFDAIDKAQGNWLLGAQSAYKDYLASASDVAGQSASLFVNAFDGMSNALANFATTGKLNFKGLVVSILGDMAKLEARVALSKILQSIMGAIIGSSGGNGEMATSFNSDGTFFSPYAKGGVFNGSPSLSAYSGQVVSSPTMFAFARGAGVMGEAGPEAIMPLKRGSDGKLGIKAMGGSGDIIVNTNVTVDNAGNTQSQTSGTSQDSARQLGKIIETKVREVMTSEARQGGQLWRMQHS